MGEGSCDRVPEDAQHERCREGMCGSVAPEGFQGGVEAQ